MYKEFDDIVTKFKEINSKGYIKGINNNLLNSVGLTLEDLLGKKPDSLFFPDYKGIEIKTTQRFSGYPITLFTTSFDGPSIFESNYILNTYGKYDVQYKDKKVLMTSLYFNKKILYNNYYFQLVFDEKNEFIYIKIYDSKFKLLEKRGIVEFKTLENKLMIKLKRLCVIYASKKMIDNNLYFRYYKMECYQLKNVNVFLNALKNEQLKISLILRISRSEKQEGKQKNKNLVVAIKKDNLESIFEKLYSFEK